MNKLDTFNKFTPKLISKSKLYNADLNNAIVHTKYVFVGEVHGTKENCDVIYSLITHYKIKNLALELGKDLKPFVDSCISNKPNFDLIDSKYFTASVMPLEMAKTIYTLIKEKLINNILYFGNGEEDDVAKEILKIKAEGPVLCLRGNWHTLPYVFTEDGQPDHISSYLIVKEEYSNTVNIEYKYQSGAIYNAGTGTSAFDDSKNPKKEYEIIKQSDYPDYYELIIPKATPINKPS